MTAVQFGSDGQALLSASTDGTVRFDHCDACAAAFDALQAQARAAVELAGAADAEAAAALAGASWLDGLRRWWSGVVRRPAAP